ncbi:MAG TPA: NAD-dependent epimerase/dehydratase family protein, partial [Polyangiaceae bacterium]|nr:NAD-dependent epimerase/dehydratase family protein [Polyangiaceae bacterium]
MTTLVTGASGFLGSHVAERLARTGRPVRALVRGSSDTSFLRTLPNVELVEGAIDDAASVRRALEGVTGIVHAAGLVKAKTPAEFMRVNAGGTETLVSAALERNGAVRRFVLVSSLAALRPSDASGTPVPEDAEPRPVTSYGKSKL